MAQKKLSWLISFCLLSGMFVPVSGQTFRTAGSRGVESSLLVGGKVVCFVKGPGRRTLYAEGSTLKVKLLDGKKVAGRISLVQDTGFVLSGRAIAYDSIKAYYVPTRVGLFLGSALCIAGGGYVLLEGLNTGFGLMMGKNKRFHMEALEVGLPILAVGGALIPLREVKRRTIVWRPRTMDLW